MSLQPPLHGRDQLPVDAPMQSRKHGVNKIREAAVTASTTLRPNQISGDGPTTVVIAPATGGASPLNRYAKPFTPSYQDEYDAPRLANIDPYVSPAGWPCVEPSELDDTQTVHPVRSPALRKSCACLRATMLVGLVPGERGRRPL